MPSADPFTRETPEAQGISSTSIHSFIDAAERESAGLHSFILLRNGALLADGWWAPYRPRDPHLLYSLSKSFTSTAIGLLVAEGRLSVDDHLLNFFPDRAPETPSPMLQAMRIRHLLTMTTGHATEPPRDQASDWVRAFFAHPVPHEPGTHFLYNSLATYMLSALVQQLTGMRLVAYLQPRLFEPLGCAPPSWEMSPQGIDAGGWGLSLTTAAIARFGQLYLQQGRWNGTQLIPKAWVQEATQRQVSNAPAPDRAPDWEQGYGYQFWRSRHASYRGDGMFGQFCIVIPEKQTVLAMTAGSSNMQHVLDLVWEHLLPGIGAAALPENPRAHQGLAQRIAGLRLPLPAGSFESPLAAQLSGQSFSMLENEDGIESISFDFTADGSLLTVRDGSGEHRIACGHGAWVHAADTLPSQDIWKVAASAAWRDDHTYVVQLWRYETPYGQTLTCSFAQDRLDIRQHRNVSFAALEGPLLQGLSAGLRTAASARGRAGS